ncbi:RNA-directed RNA polymerase [Acrasis kona]|uniref:RNA-directed RNA polymerase n=1 Tax=Acrasis kona TaxID=1008807 RepID=A0AAW2ZHI0_9EUKA
MGGGFNESSDPVTEPEYQVVSIPIPEDANTNLNVMCKFEKRVGRFYEGFTVERTTEEEAEDEDEDIAFSQIN